MKIKIIALAATLAASTIAVSSVSADYRDRYSRDDGYGYYDERRDIEEERDRLEDERRAIERERDRLAAAPPARIAEQCPSGFRPSENKCSDKERRNGCKDIRLPGGLGCVNRG